jgi:hypothetical protein
MGISTAGGRDGRRNDPRSSAPLSDRIVRGNAVFAVLRRSASPQLSAQIAQPHQSAAFWQKQKAGLRSRTRAERSAENRNKAFAFHTTNTSSFSLLGFTMSIYLYAKKKRYEFINQKQKKCCFPMRKVALLAQDFTSAGTGDPHTSLRIDAWPYQGMPTFFLRSTS